MTDSIDHSDRLAYESLLIHILTDLDPTGHWQHHTLYQRRVQRPYGGLSIGQMDDLLDHLQNSIDAIPTEAYRHWLTTRHQPPEDDVQDSSCLPTSTPMA